MAKLTCKSVLVTGASGFLGSHICETYLQAGGSVIGMDNFATGLPANARRLSENFPRQFSFYQADVCHAWPLRPAEAGNLDFVYHFASPASPLHYQRLSLETLWANSLGLQNALDFATACGARLIFASTSEVYGDPSISPQAEEYWGHVNSFGVRSCYDEAKRFGEALIYSYNQRHGTQHGLVRIFNTYGPRMNPSDGRAIVNFIMQALRGENLTIYGDGRQTRSFCYVSDLIAGLICYAERTDLIAPVNLGNDRDYSILTLAEATRALIDPSLEIEYHPAAGDDPRQRCPDLTRAKKLLTPWSPKVPLEDGLKLTANWFRSEAGPRIKSVPESPALVYF